MIIGRLTGTIAATGSDTLLIDVNGVGYVAHAGTRLLSRLAPGEAAELHIETKVSESAINLYAFGTDDERAWFVRLQDVHGVAGKAAMAVLDVLTPAEIMDAIAIGDAASFERAKGVGKKIAERLAGELAGKPQPMGRFGAFNADPAASVQKSSTPEVAVAGPRSEAVSALVNLGYAHSDAGKAVATAARDKADASVETLIKGALQELAQ